MIEISLMLLILLVSNVMGYTHKVEREDQRIELVTNETDFQQFVDDVICNYAECTMTNYSCDHRNSTKALILKCHIGLNNSNPNLNNQSFFWYDGVIIFDVLNQNHSQINTTQPLIRFINNNTNLKLNNFHITVMTNDTQQSFLFGLDASLQVGYAQNYIPEQLVKAGDSLTYVGLNYSGSNITQNFTGVALSTISVNKSNRKRRTTPDTLNFFTNASIDDSMFSQVALGNLFVQDKGFTSKQGYSYIHNLSSFISYYNYAGYYNNFAILHSSNTIWDHDISAQCFISSMVGTTFREALFKCPQGGYFNYGFLKNANITLIDSVSNTYTGGGFWSNIRVWNKFTFDYFPQNKTGDNVFVTYNFSDSQNNKYKGYTNHINEEILISKYEYTDETGQVDTFYDPLMVNITNSSYLNIVNQEMNITRKNTGILPLIKPIWERIHLTKGGGTLHLG